MTKQEVVNILKENKKKGVAYMFMPEEVRDWIGENFNDPELIYLSPSGTWRFYFETDFDDYDNVVFALHEHYQVKQEPKGEWVEFEINQRGQFLVIFTQNLRYYFNWFEWWRLLEKSIDYNYGFTAFGGWHYKDNKGWFTSPQVEIENGYLANNYSLEVKPAIPIKIRFWRESK